MKEEVKEEVKETPPAPVVQLPKTVKYTVIRGDVLWRIAKKHNTTWEHLAKMNELKNPHLIIIGQLLHVPVVK